MFKVELNQKALTNVQNCFDYYQNLADGLGDRFLDDIDKAIEALEINPFYQIRYDAVRCLPLQIFPFLVHFVVFEDKKLVRIYDILHTSIDPAEWT
jgi:hypothetical protein